MRFVSSLGKRIVQRVLGTAVPDHFVTSAPSPRHMVSLFEGGWASELPIPGVKSGASSLFDDDRIHWFLKSISGVRNARVLELGPLEGGHSCMLEQAGARQVVAGESNGRAWLKCLAVKETLGLSKVHFLLGDFVRYLEGRRKSSTSVLPVESCTTFAIRISYFRCCEGPAAGP